MTTQIKTERKEEILLKINALKNFFCWNEREPKEIYKILIITEEKIKEVLK